MIFIVILQCRRFGLLILKDRFHDFLLQSVQPDERNVESILRIFAAKFKKTTRLAVAIADD